ncbi:unnamed protein product [Linum tenue]|uniref:Pentatricopeptide repeat-containing protein n=1 Tax=Linum tenue TaxID=586396 RepID=A0AAV0PBR9_9ROSI|nr:unnamed protein product [Linum tenue]
MGALHSAASTMDEMVKEGVSPDVVSFNTALMSAFYRNGRFDDGESIWKRMAEMDIAPDIGYVKDDNLEAVKRWYGEFEKKGLALFKALFETLAPFLCEKGELQLAFELCRETIRAKCAVDAVCC